MKHLRTTQISYHPIYILTSRVFIDAPYVLKNNFLVAQFSDL
jgi:hypothetical protein